MKRSVAAMLTVALVMTVASLPSAAAGSSHAVKAKVFASARSGNHSAKAGQVALSFTDGGVRVVGSVTGAEGEAAFDVSGPLSKSALHDERLVAHAEDDHGNFDVALLVLERNAGVAPYFDKQLSKAPALMRLYLRNKATGELVALELNTVEIVGQIEQNWKRASRGAAVGEITDELWHARAGELVGTEAIELDEPGTMAMESQDRAILYRYSWNNFGHIVNEDFTVRHYVSGPDSISDQAEFHTKLYIGAERTWSPDDSEYGGADTNTEIGRYSTEPTRIDFYTESGDYVDAIDWGGAWYNKGSMNVKFNVGWSYSIPNTPVSFSATYEFGSNKTLDGHQVFTNPNSSGEWVRQQGVKIPGGGILRSTSHEMSVSPNIGHYNTPGSKTLGVQFQYGISNIGDYTYGGNKTVTLYHSYDSQG